MQSFRHLFSKLKTPLTGNKLQLENRLSDKVNDKGKCAWYAVLTFSFAKI